MGLEYNIFTKLQQSGKGAYVLSRNLLIGFAKSSLASHAPI